MLLQRTGDDLVAKVKGLINEVISWLEDKASSDATLKAHCCKVLSESHCHHREGAPMMQLSVIDALSVMVQALSISFVDATKLTALRMWTTSSLPALPSWRLWRTEIQRQTEAAAIHNFRSSLAETKGQVTTDNADLLLTEDTFAEKTALLCCGLAVSPGKPRVAHCEERPGAAYSRRNQVGWRRAQGRVDGRRHLACARRVYALSALRRGAPCACAGSVHSARPLCGMRTNVYKTCAEMRGPGLEYLLWNVCSATVRRSARCGLVRKSRWPSWSRTLRTRICTFHPTSQITLMECGHLGQFLLWCHKVFPDIVKVAQISSAQRSLLLDWVPLVCHRGQSEFGSINEWCFDRLDSCWRSLARGEHSAACCFLTGWDV